MNNKLTVAELLDKKVKCELELQRVINEVLNDFQTSTDLGIARIDLDVASTLEQHYNKALIENATITIDFERTGLKL